MSTDTLSISQPRGQRKGLSIALWTVQALLAMFFIYAGVTKLATPAEELVKMMPWTGEHPTLLPITGIVDLLGGLGILLPSLTRVLPRLAPLAGFGLIALQVLAMGFHLMRGEVALAPMNAVLLALAAFVAWGRTRALPIAAR